MEHSLSHTATQPKPVPRTRIVLGVDPDRAYEGALHLLRRLQFRHQEWSLVNAVENPLPLVSLSPVPCIETGMGMLASSTDASMRWLQDARQVLEKYGLHAESHSIIGHPSAALLLEAENEDAAFIGLGPSHKSSFERLVMGSTTRSAVANSTTSLLLAHGDVSPEGPVTAVVGLDHSSYGDRALEQFLQHDPRGLRRVLVVTAVADDSEIAAAATACDRWVTRFTHAGVHARAWVTTGDPAEVLEKAVKDSHAQLLIVGAKGHGVFARLLGSVSASVAERSRHSVLLLRAANTGHHDLGQRSPD